MLRDHAKVGLLYTLLPERLAFRAFVLQQNIAPTSVEWKQKYARLRLHFVFQFEVHRGCGSLDFCWSWWSNTKAQTVSIEKRVHGGRGNLECRGVNDLTSSIKEHLDSGQHKLLSFHQPNTALDRALFRLLGDYDDDLP